jgi:hypothetical protein
LEFTVADVPSLYVAVAVTVVVRVTEPPTLNVIAEALTERLVTVCVDEVVAVGAAGEGLEPDPPQALHIATMTARRLAIRPVMALPIRPPRSWCRRPSYRWLAGGAMRLTRVRGVSSLRLVIRVDQGPGCRLHPLQRLCQTHQNQMTQYLNDKTLQAGFQRVVFDMLLAAESRSGARG